MEEWMLVPVLIGIGFTAGFFDTIAGGGGLISLTGLILIGLDPITALTTNKMQSVFSSSTASIVMLRKKIMDWRESLIPVLICLCFSMIGAVTLFQVDKTYIEWVVPFLLTGVALFLIFRKKLDDSQERKPILKTKVYNSIFPPMIAFYDGFFGPGTGTFLAVSGNKFLGLKIVKATAKAKPMNFASNLGALLVFLFIGDIRYDMAIFMILGQIAGGYIGARTVIAGGEKIIRPTMIAIMLALIFKFAFEKLT